MELNANQKASTGAVKLVAFLIVLGVVIYSEVMFLGIISVLFPDGILRVGATMGAIATGASVLALYWGKSRWFSPGEQLIAAWTFTGVEIAIMILNDILAFSLHNGHVDGYLALWYQVVPASPVVALVGWVIITYLDRSRRKFHQDLEMSEKREDMERDYTLEAFKAHMKLKTNHLQQVVARLDDALASPHVQAQIDEHAKRMVAGVLTDVSGINAFTGFNSPTPQVVDSHLDRGVSLGQTAQASILDNPDMKERFKNDGETAANIQKVEKTPKK